MTQIFQQAIDTPIGPLVISATTSGVCSVVFSEPLGSVKANQHTQHACEQLSEYFAGQRREFSVSLAIQGTAFQQRVWQSLSKIGYGETASYAHIARDINNEKAVRAVGLANGRNPIAIIIPCHRIVGSNGKLTGYAGGLDRKAFLLNLEQEISCR